jgi:hypothetical protein
MLAVLGALAASALAGDWQPTPPCSQLEGQTVTLRGTVSRVGDNMSPDTDLGDRLVVDPKEEIVIVTLRHPICIAPEDSTQARPVVQPLVTLVELIPAEGMSDELLRSHLGKVRTVEGTLSTNVWWHYKATMQIVAMSIKK